MNLWAAIWKMRVRSVKPNSCSQFSPLRSQSLGLCTLIYTQLYCPWCLGPEQPKVELQVIKCIVVTSTVSWHRGQGFYSSLPLIVWVMLFLTSLCEGCSGHSELFVLPLEMLSLGRQGLLAAVDQESCHLPALRWAAKMSNMSSSLPINPEKAATAASQSMCSLQRSESWRKWVFQGTTWGELPAQCPQQEPGFKSWSTLLLASGQGTKNTFKPATTGYPHALSGTSQALSVPHKVWPNLTLISLSYLVSHVNMKGI